MWNPGSVQALNETTFLVIYASGILADEMDLLLKRLRIGWANQWLSPVMR